MPGYIRGAVPLFLCSLRPNGETEWCGRLRVSCEDGECRAEAETSRGTGFLGRPRGEAVVRFEAPYVSQSGTVYRALTRRGRWEPCMTLGGCSFEYRLPGVDQSGFRLSTRWDPARPVPYRLAYWHEPAWPGGWAPYALARLRKPQGRPRAVVLGLARWPVRVHRFRGYQDRCGYTTVLPGEWRVARYWWVLPLCLDTGGGCRWISTLIRRLEADREGRAAHWWASCRLAGRGLAPGETATMEARLVGVPARYAGGG